MTEKMERSTIVRKGGSKRLLALDAVRGLAVIGMYIQHFALNERNGFVSGNTMILFILCSGISYTMMGQSMERRSVEPGVFRARVLARSVFIDLAGYCILLLNGPFGVVLQAYAMLFLLALVLVKRSTKTLIIVSAAGFLLCPPLMLAGMSLFEGVAILSDIAGGPLSGLAWFPVFVAGMAIGRMNLLHIVTKIRLIVVGALVLIPTKLFALFVLPDLYQSFCNWLMKFSDTAAAPVDPYVVWPKNTMPPLWHMLLLDVPQGGSTFELLIGMGGCLMLLGVILLLENKCSVILHPFAGTGRVSLTLYSVQFVLAWVLMLLGTDPTAIVTDYAFNGLIVAILVLGAGWLISRLPNGPLEAAICRFEGLFYKK